MAEKKEFVDREAVLATAFETIPLVGTSPAEAMGISRMSAAVYRALRNIPAADVVPVRHGKWDCFIDFVTCSLCGYTSTDRDNHGDPVSLNYCPNCGAKMDGGENDEKENP